MNRLSPKNILTSLLLFVIAGFLEIGGGYLVWLWLRNDFSWILGALGGFVLFLYGVVPTFQKTHFHRIYAAYGGVFIVMSVFWGWLIDGVIPDIYEIIGAIIAVIGIGYADGILRKLSDKGYVYYKNYKFKIIGRISMDTITIDITKHYKKLKIGMMIDLINYENDIEKIAKNCDTISNEILTLISNRVKRVYMN